MSLVLNIYDFLVQSAAKLRLLIHSYSQPKKNGAARLRDKTHGWYIYHKRYLRKFLSISISYTYNS